MWIFLLLSIAVLLILQVRRKYSYWKRHGVPFIQPRFPFGSITPVGDRVHSSQLMARFYNQLKGTYPFAGMYFFTNPVVLALDLDFIKNVLVRDFQYFHDRGLYHNEKDDPLTCHLFNIEGTKWTNLRRKLLPTFSSGKMKMMCPTILAIADRFRTAIENSISDQNEIEMRDFLARFTTDVIGTCAFGIDCNSLENPDAEFLKMGNKIFEVPTSRIIAYFFVSTFQELSKKLHIKAVPEDVSRFFYKVVRETMAYRQSSGVQRNDFMNLLMQLKEKGELEGSDEKLGTLTLDEVVAQAYVFFLGGYETSSTNMCFCLYELALNGEIQEKARECVQKAVAKHGGLNYEALMDMPYLEQCIYEALRKYPPIANLFRSVTQDYNVPNSNVMLPKGMNVWIPIYAIHHDPEFFPEPELFDPERFTQEECEKRKPFTYMPFGEGPRTCIATRFGMMETKTGLATLLMNFKFTKSARLEVPPKFSTKHVMLTPVGGLWVKVEKIEQ
ncbi:AAEL009137-PA [Aedes aegypti]|uniref:AAEL009137-PA n=2 Tax=Aedes aegypti TaxID=7159 RepID=A0A1S4FLF3_AEDAE|nr:probable cytochrome P450 6a14 [Aedes aegypti]EAT39033.1 AAEL009137-PA [Aedes aegypti]